MKVPWESLAAYLLAAYALFDSYYDIRFLWYLRNQEKDIASNDTENEWGYGQILAVFVWVPVLVEYFYILGTYISELFFPFSLQNLRSILLDLSNKSIFSTLISLASVADLEMCVGLKLRFWGKPKAEEQTAESFNMHSYTEVQQEQVLTKTGSDVLHSD